MTSHLSDKQAPPELQAFISQCQDGLRQQVQGNSQPFLDVWSHADDVAILGAIGSYARGWHDVRTHILAAAQTLDWTSVAIEPIVTVSSGGLAVSVALERMTRQLPGSSDARTLRVTHAYRLEQGQWRLILRHANQVSPEDQDRERTILGDTRGS